MISSRQLSTHAESWKSESSRFFLVDTLQPVEILIFELYWRNTVCITMTWFRVVEHFDVVKDITPGFFLVAIDLAADSFPF
jgi:hypothetical protein